MPYKEIGFQLPEYTHLENAIKVLSLPLPISELHGVMCGYLCAGSVEQGEVYIRSLMHGNKGEQKKTANLAIFDLYTISQHQIINFDPAFQLLLPEDTQELKQRARAFGQWCNGFMDGISMAGINLQTLDEQDAQNAILHISQFADLNYDGLNTGEEDEKALLEVSEYTRMAVLHIHNIIKPTGSTDTELTSH